MSKRRAILGLAILLGAGAASSCSETPGPMLHRMNSYAGTVRVTPDAGAARECDLAFDRRNGNLQVVITEGKRVVTLVRGADGKPSAFEDAKERKASAGEVARFDLVRDLTESRAIEAVETGAKTYRIQRGGTWFAVELESQTGTRMHGQPR